MAKHQCETKLGNAQCIGEQGHPGRCCVFEDTRPSQYWDGRGAVVVVEPPKFDFVEPEPEDKWTIAWAFKYTDGSELNNPTMQLGYGVVETDPLKLPLPPIAKNADWSTKDRQIEWVRANFTPGMLAKLYKLSYDVDKLRRDGCDEIIRKG